MWKAESRSRPWKKVDHRSKVGRRSLKDTLRGRSVEWLTSGVRGWSLLLRTEPVHGREGDDGDKNPARSLGRRSGVTGSGSRRRKEYGFTEK